MRPQVDVEARLQQLIIPATLSVLEAIEVMDRCGSGSLLLCDAERRLQTVLAASDVREAVLRSEPLNQPCSQVATRAPFTVQAPLCAEDERRLAARFAQDFIELIPVVDEAGRVVDVYLRGDLTSEDYAPLAAVIMAGGSGLRLRPLTETLPKVMLPVGGRPLLEITIGRLRDAGIRHIYISTHYMGGKIIEAIGDGGAHGVQIQYLHEETPLGTAGGLSLIGAAGEPLLVINGDILTRLDFRAMYAFHQRHEAALTLGVRTCAFQIPYGVVDCSGVEISGVREKPVIGLTVNAGVYLLGPDAQQLIPQGARFDMPDLVNMLVERGQRVVKFPIIEYWQDIGQHADYEKVQRDVQDGRVKA